MFDKQDLIRCVGCNSVQPQTDTHYTLISSRYGWRLSRTFDDTGKKVLEWRCPKCWSEHRERAKQEAQELHRLHRAGS